MSTSAAVLQCDDLTYRYPGGMAGVQGVSFNVGPGETLVIVGRSGSGKSTLLRLCNRLLVPDQGGVRLNGQPLTAANAVALRRQIGYVVQQIGLFPHLSIVENVALPGRAVGWPRARRLDAAHARLTMVGLDPDRFAQRFPSTLSGGEQQRVGVARALLLDPPLLLLDEPLGALDPATRHALQAELQQWRHTWSQAMVWVTHDRDEALAMGDRIAVMQEGRLTLIGSPAAVRAAPADSPIAQWWHGDPS